MGFKFNMLFITSQLLLLVFMFPSYAKGENAEHHYYDIHGNSLEKYDNIWTKLNEYYGRYLPKNNYY